MTKHKYILSLDMVISMLNNCSSFLLKTERFLNKRHIDPILIASDRLIFDMYPLTRQIQIGTDMVRKGFARLAEIETTKFEDDEITIQDLIKRIKDTINFLSKIDQKKFTDADIRPISFFIRDKKFDFKNGDDYLYRWILPHFFFHITTTYNIIRKNGVNLGKWDFTGKF